MNKEYFKYLIKKKGYSIKEMGTLIGLSERQFHYLSQTGNFKLSQIKVILKCLNMKFEEVFVDDN